VKLEELTGKEELLAYRIDSLERVVLQAGLFLSAPGEPPSAADVQEIAKALLAACPGGRTFGPEKAKLSPAGFHGLY
jgi:hypothetical protein